LLLSTMGMQNVIEHTIGDFNGKQEVNKSQSK